MGNFGAHPLLVGTYMVSLNNNFNLTPDNSSSLPNNPIPINFIEPLPTSSNLEHEIPLPKSPSLIPSSFLKPSTSSAQDGFFSGNEFGMDMDYSLGLYQRNAASDATLQPFNPSSPPRKKVRGGNKRKYQDANVTKAIFDLEEENWARFFVIKKKDGSFVNDCSFKLSQDIKTLLGKTKSNKKMGDGTLCIEVATKEQAKKIMAISKLNESDVEINLHKKLNTSQGVITCRDFLNSSIEDIKTGLSDEGVVEARRIKRRQGDALVDTASLVLTFNRPKPPTSIEAAFYKLKVRPYIPSPMRCFRCQRFGHTSQRCKVSEQVCVCGKPSHEGECTPPITCVNCGGEHLAKASICPVLQEEKEVQKVRTLQQLPYHEARAIVRSKAYVKPDKSYAQAANIEQKSKPIVKFVGSQSKTSGPLTKLGQTPALRGNNIKAGPTLPLQSSAPTGASMTERSPSAPKGEMAVDRLPKSPSTEGGGSVGVDQIPPQAVPLPGGEWRVVDPRRRSQRIGAKATSPRALRRRGEKNLSVGDQKITKSPYMRRSPRPKWQVTGTDLDASESEGGGVSERPPTRRKKERIPRRTISD